MELLDSDLPKLILIPLVAALIGWLTNWVAVKMLFHPKQPINLGLFTLQGVFHKRQKDLARRLGDLIETKLFSHSDIHEKLTSPEFVARLTPILERHLDQFIAERLTGIHPMLALLPEQMRSLIKEKLMEEFEALLPRMLEGASDSLEDLIQIKDVIRKKVEAFDVSQMEEILFSILKNEFKMIEYVGGVLGFFIGIAQVMIYRYL